MKKTNEKEQRNSSMSVEKYGEFTTEKKNENSKNIDKLSSFEIVKLINDEDKKVAYSVEKVLDSVAKAIDMTAERLGGGGRIFYIGAGTSGRLAVIDAAECPPTYGTDPTLVQAVMAGGNEAVWFAGEGNEDDPKASIIELKKRGFNSSDVCFGISASGSASFVQSAMKYARSLGALTIAYSCNTSSALIDLIDVMILPVVGPEVICGSTRMKAATAQKMVLTMYSTGVMVKLGRVKGNLMLCMKPSNKKLVARAVRMICDQTGCDDQYASEILTKCGMDITKAIDMIEKDKK